MMVLQNKNEALSRKIQLIPLKDVHEGKAKRVEIEGLRIAVTYINGSVYAFSDMCTHANYALSEGPIHAEDLTIECWKHGAQFCLKTGQAISLPATRPMNTYQVEVIDGDVYVHLPQEGSP
ncbi:MAG: hypothetical protein CBC37_06050 [Acidimicrobiaceae bacterium TMED77]|nr:MAG: hypothetical protein CBC37_06050 [Acidimicrobiaceae bacterium TMED77]|tara:strand:+ start:8845 stop:9207 length:363 start_codon:yes stop_codon:yes gene_type:complete